MRDFIKILRDNVVVLMFAAVLLMLFVVFGCAPQKPRPVQQPQASPVPEVAAPSPAPVAWEPQYQPAPPPPRPQRTLRHIETMGPGGKTIVYEPGKKYPLYCSEFGTLTVRFPEGETIQMYNSGNSAEWMIEKKNTGLDLPIGVLGIRRAPYAASSELHVTTDSATYQFLLIPQGSGVAKQQVSLFTVVNPETEARRQENQDMHAMAMEEQRTATEIRAPLLDAATFRTYEIGGDHVAWAPTDVLGDHRQTVIQLPRSTGADLPMLTIIEYGKEMRVNTRTLPEDEKHGPRIVVDQPFSEARLIGSGGTVSIIGRGN